jgi:hypothetical protein
MKLIISCVAQHQITPKSQPLQICKDCKHFQASRTMGVRYGSCKLFGVQDLVDGSIRHDYASIAREYKCKGEYFEPKQNHIADFLKQYNIDLDDCRTYDK